MNKKKIKKAALLICTMVVFMAVSIPVMATETTTAAQDPLTAINNLNDIIFAVIKVIGLGICGFGFFNFGSSFSSHDAGQRAMGIASIAGGLIIVFAKQILVAIGAV